MGVSLRLQYSNMAFALLLACLPFSVGASDYGTTGLIDIPTARSGADAEFATTFAYQDRTKSVALTYQALPWLEATFRYTGFNDFFYYDRNYELKARLWEERSWLPQVAVGIRDLVGTGVFGSEYVVANKQFGNLDTAFGLGWGRLAGDGLIYNPMRLLSNSFDEREREFGQGGTLASKQFFSGKEVGVFGGVRYQFDERPLALLAEYNPDQYEWDQERGGVAPPSSPWSFGVEWQVTPNISLALSHQHGDEWGLSVRVSALSNTPAPRYEPKPMLSSHDMADDELPPDYNRQVWYDMLLYDIARIGVPMSRGQLSEDGTKATVQVANHTFAYWPDAIEKAHQFAEVHLPASVEQVDYIVQENDHQVMTVSLPRTLLSQTQVPPKPVEFATLSEVEPIDHWVHTTDDTSYKPIVDVTLDHRLMLFDPNNPLAYQLYAKVGSKIRLPGGIDLKGAYAFDVMNNVEGMRRDSTSTLPHVRSDALLYLQQGKNGLSHLLLDKRGTFAPNWHYRAYGGVLETMYSGVGGEVLYTPFASRFAFGASANWVKQRDYDRSFKHLDYSTSTAFVSAYWATPYNNYDVAVHAGRYLAKDVGATFELRRTFNNGWMVGLWATFTDVPFDTFGEGSFDKGMFFRIPLGNLGDNGRAAYTSRIRPIQRDGGARLEGYSGRLWWDLREARYDVFKGGR
ncbi:MAG: hypothetical protein RL336_803 [Pseudomonadota bacterium]|jgi:hypothetical protein